ncbi:hypothetical protein CEUSTIGMA_g3598.t1 [Chlamydomonas eustigma]|uniref:Large ribosomal subunit protein bL28c n=1 Tax=Chlamydomonas eustigma TaxID=1157962 RepID=A0A250WZ81_9CHLO|nr:hypothetical protein CEUSTIGMA_g3598.t1 [Chlamydomonas eustigma]|eukprot:GAX76154.1 hypothetical protein CEUSTIGMA_g3598.t1 [Chlamydomonas eustigma]
MASLCSTQSLFTGRQTTFQPARTAQRVAPASRCLVPVVQASKTCELNGKRRNKANAVSFSNKKNRKWQEPNLQAKKFYWANGQRWVNLRVSTKAIKTIEKNGLDSMAKEAGIDLWKLPFVDVRPERLQYLQENKGKVPVAVNPRAMKNPEKLAASKKPRVPVYTITGRIAWVRPGTEDLYTRDIKEQVKAVEGQQ